jgi:AAA domain
MTVHAFELEDDAERQEQEVRRVPPPAENADEFKSNDAGEERPLPLGEEDIGDITAPEPRGWLLGNSFCREFATSLLAGGGTGKTARRYPQYLSLALGRSLTGEHVFQRGRVLVISLEDGIKELKRRMLAAMIHHNVKREDVAGWLFYASPGAAAGKLMTMDRAGRGAVIGDLVKNIEATIIRRKIDLVAIDPFVKSHSVPENENSLIDEVAQVLTDLAIKHGISIDSPHHVSKGGPDPGNADRGRGASARNDAFRLVFTLTTMSVEEAKIFGINETERKQYIREDSGKVNIIKGGGNPKWFRLVSVPIGNGTELYPHGDEVQTTEVWKPPELWADISADLLNQALDEIDAGLSDGNKYSENHRAGEKRAAWKVVAKVAPHKTEEQAKKIIKEWIRTGVLMRCDYENPETRKEVSGLEVDQTKRPSR